MAPTWFGEPELVTTNFTASHACNNLSKLGDALVYVHEDDVVFAAMKELPYATHKLPIMDKSFVYQARMCSLLGATVVVVATEKGVQIFDEKGDARVYELLLKDHIDAVDEGGASFCRGVCAVNSDQQSVLVVGTSTGNCFVLGADKSAKAATAHDLELALKVTDHKDAIQCMDSSANGAYVAVSDDSGMIIVHDANDKFSIAKRIRGNQYPATALRFTPSGWLVSGDLTGTLRIFHKKTFLLYTEVAAHTRAITAMDVNDDYIVSVGEDTFMNVWEFGDSKSTPRINLLSAQCVPNDILVGVAFTGTQTVITTSYDTAHLKLWLPM